MSRTARRVELAVSMTSISNRSQNQRCEPYSPRSKLRGASLLAVLRGLAA